MDEFKFSDGSSVSHTDTDTTQLPSDEKPASLGRTVVFAFGTFSILFASGIPLAIILSQHELRSEQKILYLSAYIGVILFSFIVIIARLNRGAKWPSLSTAMAILAANHREKVRREQEITFDQKIRSVILSVICMIAAMAAFSYYITAN